MTSVAAALRYRRLKKLAFSTAIAVLWLGSRADRRLQRTALLERQYPAKPMAETPDADVAIILGGAVGQPLPPRVEVGLSEATGRVLHAARLYKASKVQRILITAGNLPWLPAVKPEAELIKDLLVEWGVAAANRARQRQPQYVWNALEIKAIWQRQHFASALLVTSAWHCQGQWPPSSMRGSRSSPPPPMYAPWRAYIPSPSCPMPVR